MQFSYSSLAGNSYEKAARFTGTKLNPPVASLNLKSSNIFLCVNNTTTAAESTCYTC